MWEEKYKTASKTTEALLLLAGESVGIIVGKFASIVGHVNNLIKTDNMVALKKRYPVITNEFREYTSLTTSLNTMAKNAANIEYNRKSVALLMHGKSKFSDDVRTHVKTKTEKIEKNLSDFISSVKVCVNAIKFFGNLEASDDAQSSESVTSLKGLANEMASIIKKLEDRSIDDVRLASKEIIKITGSNSSSSSNSSDGGDSDDNVIMIGGFSDGEPDAMVIDLRGGIDERKSRASLYEKDIKDKQYGIYGSFEEYKCNVMKPSLRKMYPESSPKKLASLEPQELVDYFRKINKVADYSSMQLQEMQKTGALETISQYLAKHYKQYLGESAPKSYIPNIPGDNLQDTLKFFQSADESLREIDEKIVEKYVTEALKDTKTEKSEPPPEPIRSDIKEDIRKSVENYKDLLEKITEVRKKYNPTSSNTGNNVDDLIKFEESIYDVLCEEGSLHSQAAGALHDIIKKWHDFISPDNVKPCIRKVIAYIVYKELHD
jgi:hypothetical protein